MSFAAPDRTVPATRIGAVTYLNTVPLVRGLQAQLPTAELSFDYPSRLADELAEGRLDVALAPCIEVARHPEWSIVSTACIGCRGPVLSVKVLFRRPPAEVRTLALDEGSRTSAVLAQILLADRFGTRPKLQLLPLASSPLDSTADAVLVIGDRAIRPVQGDFCEAWDLGEEWVRETGLPFVFAVWAARPRTFVEGERSHLGGGAAEQHLHAQHWSAAADARGGDDRPLGMAGDFDARRQGHIEPAFGKFVGQSARVVEGKFRRRQLSLQAAHERHRVEVRNGPNACSGNGTVERGERHGGKR